MNGDDLKQSVLSMGADLCGTASAESFSGAPEGFRPGDVWSRCRTVLVYGLRVPGISRNAESRIPYTLVNSLMAAEVDRFSLGVSRMLDSKGLDNVPIPSDDPYEEWDEDLQRGQAILSLRHAGELAGLGRLGRSNLLINQRFGSMIQLGAVLLAEGFDPDPPADYEVCPKDCAACIDGCPVSAIRKGYTVQKLCRPLSVHRNRRGFMVKECRECRRLCPSAAGTKEWSER